ncbi:hypothetical protein [Nocardioides sp.]|uniref:hypothetical protein n=1 Tax=Nocardioides sp. TaxID=35761 RepID=UPI0025FD3D57|nr:hypothetical protein [Nocardioides sp.]
MNGPHVAKRRRGRNELLLIGLVPSLIALAVAVVLIVTLGRDAMGRAASARGDQERAQSLFAANRWIGAIEPWVAPYNEGVAALRGEDYEAALAGLSAALRDVPAEEECRVVLNIAITLERMGDRAVSSGEDATALDDYRRGREVIAAERCASRIGVAEGVVDDLKEVDDRLAAKAGALLDRQEQDIAEDLSPAERHRLARAQADDERAERLEQRLVDPPVSTPGGAGYGW